MIGHTNIEGKHFILYDVKHIPGSITKISNKLAVRGGTMQNTIEITIIQLFVNLTQYIV